MRLRYFQQLPPNYQQLLWSRVFALKYAFFPPYFLQEGGRREKWKERESGYGFAKNGVETNGAEEQELDSITEGKGMFQPVVQISWLL